MVEPVHLHFVHLRSEASGWLSPLLSDGTLAVLRHFVLTSAPGVFCFAGSGNSTMLMTTLQVLLANF